MKFIKNLDAWLNRNLPGQNRSFTSVEHFTYGSVSVFLLVLCVALFVWSAVYLADLSRSIVNH